MYFVQVTSIVTITKIFKCYKSNDKIWKAPRLTAAKMAVVAKISNTLSYIWKQKTKTLQYKQTYKNIYFQSFFIYIAYPFVDFVYICVYIYSMFICMFIKKYT